MLYDLLSLDTLIKTDQSRN